jgi:hypothetical protein
MRTLLIALLAIFALAACSSGGGDSATQETATADQTTADHATEAPAEVAAVEVKTGEVELAGTLGCGHCSHGIGDGCSAAVQTADGAIYILEEMAAGDEPFDQRFDGKQITVRGTAVERDGVGYITGVTFEL